MSEASKNQHELLQENYPEFAAECFRVYTKTTPKKVTGAAGALHSGPAELVEKLDPDTYRKLFGQDKPTYLDTSFED